MTNPFEELGNVADRVFNVVWVSVIDAVQILDDLYEFREVMNNNGVDYDLNEREGKYTNDLNKRITDLGKLLVGRKEFVQYLETEDIYMTEYDKGFFRSKNEEFKKKQE